MYYNSLLKQSAIHPLVRLNKVTKGIKGTILAKVEYFNPGNSVKDRMAIKMLEDAEKARKNQTRWYYYRRHFRYTGMGWHWRLYPKAIMYFYYVG
jgi:hypothetical protein